jgi:ubiquinone/menaquinone biosynthesis C-methylase UbiE
MVKEEDVVKFYVKEAEKYEEKRFANNRGKYEDKFQKDVLFSMVNSWEGLSILEVGCGTGRFSIEVQKKGALVIALDPAFSMLIRLKGKINTKREDKIELVCGSGLELPFKDNVFDGCICVNVLSHLPNYERAFREINRCLKPCAFFIFNIPNLLSPLLLVGLWVNLRKKSLINPVYTKWYTLGEIKKNLEKAGFEIEAVKGVFIPAVIPIPLQIIKRVNEFSVNRALKYVSTDIFIKAIAKKGKK